MRWDGMRYAMGWDEDGSGDWDGGTEWVRPGMGCDEMGWMGRNLLHGSGTRRSCRMGWDGVGWSGMGPDGMTWDGTGSGGIGKPCSI